MTEVTLPSAALGKGDVEMKDVNETPLVELPPVIASMKEGKKQETQVVAMDIDPPAVTAPKIEVAPAVAVDIIKKDIAVDKPVVKPPTGPKSGIPDRAQRRNGGNARGGEDRKRDRSLTSSRVSISSPRDRSPVPSSARTRGTDRSPTKTDRSPIKTADMDRRAEGEKGKEMEAGKEKERGKDQERELASTARIGQPSARDRSPERRSGPAAQGWGNNRQNDRRGRRDRYESRGREASQDRRILPDGSTRASLDRQRSPVMSVTESFRGARVVSSTSAQNDRDREHDSEKERERIRDRESERERDSRKRRDPDDSAAASQPPPKRARTDDTMIATSMTSTRTEDTRTEPRARQVQPVEASPRERQQAIPRSTLRTDNLLPLLCACTPIGRRVDTHKEKSITSRVLAFLMGCRRS